MGTGAARMTTDPRWAERLGCFARDEQGRDFELGDTDCHALVLRALRIVFPELDVDVGYATTREAIVRFRNDGGLPDELLRRGWRRLRSSYGVPPDVFVHEVATSDDRPDTCGIFVRRGWILTASRDEGVVLRDFARVYGPSYVLRAPA